ncbi:MAG: hypothetical protein ABI303_01870 [Candidatus Saccharimonas sp.]
MDEQQGNQPTPPTEPTPTPPRPEDLEISQVNASAGLVEDTSRETETNPNPTIFMAPSHRNRNLLIAAIALVLLIAIGMALWMLLKPATKESAVSKPDTSKTDASQVAVTKVPKATAESVTTTVHSSLDKDMKSTYPTLAITASDKDSTPPANGPSYKVTGANYYVASSDAYTLNIDKSSKPSANIDTEFTKAIIAKIEPILLTNGYAKTDSLNSFTEYQSDNTICTVTTFSAEPITLSCSDKATYKVASDTILPFADAYIIGNGTANDATNQVFSMPDVKNSATAGYKTASINLSSRDGFGGAAYLFYQKGSDKWQFFTGTQSILPCTDYKTLDQRAAFSSDQCGGNGDVITTVQAYYKLKS